MIRSLMMFLDGILMSLYLMAEMAYVFGVFSPALFLIYHGVDPAAAYLASCALFALFLQVAQTALLRAWAKRRFLRKEARQGR